MTKSLSHLAPALAFTLAGCAGAVIYEGRSGYNAGDFDYATRKGAIETIVAGNPFGGGKAAFDARVLDLMQGQNRGLPSNFVATAGPQTDPNYRVVVAFDPPGNAIGDGMCRDAAQLASRPRAGEVRLSIAFCEGKAAKSYASGSDQGVAGTEDPKFARLVRQVTYFMVPDDAFVEHLRISE